MLGELLSGIIDVLWPSLCAACSAVSAVPFCDACAATVTQLPGSALSPLLRAGRVPQLHLSSLPRSPSPFERVFTPFIHEGAVASAIHLFKYEDRADLADPLGRLVASAVPLDLRGGDTLVSAVPLHRLRYLARQYDQAQLLARRVARALDLSYAPRALQRVRHTARQVGETLAAREANVRGAFLGKPVVKGARVLLVDDVVTTGATARAAAQALLLAGARRVDVASVARAFSAEEAVHPDRPAVGSG